MQEGRKTTDRGSSVCPLGLFEHFNLILKTPCGEIQDFRVMWCFECA